MRSGSDRIQILRLPSSISPSRTPRSEAMIARRPPPRTSWIGVTKLGAGPSALVVHVTCPLSRTNWARRHEMKGPLRVGVGTLADLAKPAWRPLARLARPLRQHQENPERLEQAAN